MSRKKILFKDILRLSDVLAKPQPGVINLVGPINESFNETHFIRVRGKAKHISKKPSEGFLTVNSGPCSFNSKENKSLHY